MNKTKEIKLQSELEAILKGLEDMGIIENGRVKV